MYTCFSLHMLLKNLVIRWTRVYVITIWTLFYLTIISCHTSCQHVCWSNRVHSTGHQHMQCSSGRSDEQWYLSHNDTCHTMIPVTQWYLSHNDTCHKMIPVIQWYLSHNDTCHTMIPVTQWYLSHNNTCHTMIPVTQWYLSHNDTCHTMIPITQWYLSYKAQTLLFKNATQI